MLPCRPLVQACACLGGLLAALALQTATLRAQEDGGWADPPGASDLNSAGPGSGAVPLAAPPERAASAGETSLLDYSPELEGADASRSRIVAILARPEFREGATPPPQPSWLEQLLGRLANWLARLFTPLAGASVAVQVLAVAGMLLLGGLLVYYLARLIWMLAAAKRSRSGEGTPGQPELSRPEELLAAARQALAGGDYRQALRLRFRALLASLDLSAAPLMTNRELADQVGCDVPEAGMALSALIRLFEDAWYGGGECGRLDYEQGDQLARDVEDRVRLARAEAAA